MKEKFLIESTFKDYCATVDDNNIIECETKLCIEFYEVLKLMHNFPKIRHIDIDGIKIKRVSL